MNLIKKIKSILRYNKEEEYPLLIELGCLKDLTLSRIVSDLEKKKNILIFKIQQSKLSDQEHSGANEQEMKLQNDLLKVTDNLKRWRDLSKNGQVNTIYDLSGETKE